MAELLGALSDSGNVAFSDFARLLVQSYDEDDVAKNDGANLLAFWGSDPRMDAAACKSAVLRLVIPADDCIRKIAHAVDAAVKLGLIVFDDETGMCFLPDGRILPETDREMWEFNLAQMRAGSPNPNAKQTDNRTFLQKLGGELIDAVGRGNRHQ